MTEDQEGGTEKPAAKGTQAIVGAVVAIVGALAAVNPTSAVLRVLSEAAPQLAGAIPLVVTACGALLAAVSEPPQLPKRK